MDTQSPERGFFNALSPKGAFWFGSLAGLGILFTIGFFILLAIVLQDDSVPSTTNTNTAQANVNAPTPAPDPTAAVLPTDEDIQIDAVTDADWVKGDANAVVTVVEFSDTECPYCKRFHTTMNQIVEQYDGQVRWVYRHFPIPELHSKATREAEATECAGELGGNDGFWAYIDLLYETTTSNDGLADDQLPVIAEEVGLDREAFVACLDSGRHETKVQEHSQMAVTAGATGTPYSVIIAGDQTIPLEGAYPINQVQSILNTLTR